MWLALSVMLWQQQTMISNLLLIDELKQYH